MPISRWMREAMETDSVTPSRIITILLWQCVHNDWDTKGLWKIEIKKGGGGIISIK